MALDLNLDHARAPKTILTRAPLLPRGVVAALGVGVAFGVGIVVGGGLGTARGQAAEASEHLDVLTRAEARAVALDEKRASKLTYAAELARPDANPVLRPEERLPKVVTTTTPPTAVVAVAPGVPGAQPASATTRPAAGAVPTSSSGARAAVAPAAPALVTAAPGATARAGQRAMDDRAEPPELPALIEADERRANGSHVATVAAPEAARTPHHNDGLDDDDDSAAQGRKFAPEPSHEPGHEPGREPAREKADPARLQAALARVLGSAPAVLAPRASPSGYALQLASTPTRESAEAMVHKLIAQGHTGARVVEGDVGGKAVFRVRVSGFTERAAADAYKGKLATPAFIVAE